MQKLLTYFQWIFNTTLLILGILLVILLFKQLYDIGAGILFYHEDIHDILQNVLLFFLSFAFLSTIPKYFKENYQFPIRYLLYVGITGTIRFILVNNQNATNNLILSLVIFVLIIGYILLNRFETNYSKPQ